MNKFVIANWKMNPSSVKEAEVIFKETVKISNKSKNTNVVICPPFPFLSIGSKLKSQSTFLGAESVFPEISGSYTGEVSIKMLKSLNVKYVIVGHSERRALGETDEYVNKQIEVILKEKITPVFCIGERARDKEGSYLSFIKDQLIKGLANISKLQIKNIIIAYEPVWAIGSNAKREATVDEFIEMKIFIKKVISDIYGSKIAHGMKIIYGGSVHPSNARSFVVDGGADGLLVGRDSLTGKSLSLIIDSIK